ncbi:MAG: hypothetical protein IKZ69_02930 [Lachnospiraceae bacterium]|nr:hypothetical protein [Lachnospiraceae bacterium]
MSSDFGIKKALLLGIGVGVLLPIAFIIALHIGNAKERKYLKDGVLTTCTVQTVLTVNHRQQVTVVYEDKNGKLVKANAVLNQSVYAGEKVQAYVLESDPTEVYYPAGSFWKWMCYIIVGLFAVGAWIPLIVVIRQQRFEKMAEQFKEMSRLNKMNQNKSNDDRKGFFDDNLPY